MIERVETMFDNMLPMMKKLKKASYEKNMKTFRETYGHFFEEMKEYVEAGQDKEAAAKELADVFTDAVKGRFTINGRIKSRTQADMNFFMIYYVFPAILLLESAEKELIAKSIRDEWASKFKDSDIGYADYEKIYEGFHEKILGFF